MAQQKLDKSVQLRVAYKVLTCLTETQINDVLFIFSQFIFNIDMYAQNMNLSSDKTNKMKSTYGKVCAETYFNNAHLQVQEVNFAYLFGEFHQTLIFVLCISVKSRELWSNSAAVQRLAWYATFKVV